MSSNDNLGYFDNYDYENNLSTSFSELNLNKNVDKIFRCKLCKKIPVILSIKVIIMLFYLNVGVLKIKFIVLKNPQNFIIILQKLIKFIAIIAMKKKIFYFLI